MSEYPKSMGHIDAGVLAELLEAADAAEFKLRTEYRHIVCPKCGLLDATMLVREDESWAEGERLRDALDNLRTHMNAQSK